MKRFLYHLSTETGVDPDDGRLVFTDTHAAYLHAVSQSIFRCGWIPEMSFDEDQMKRFTQKERRSKEGKGARYELAANGEVLLISKLVGWIQDHEEEIVNQAQLERLLLSSFSQDEKTDWISKWDTVPLLADSNFKKACTVWRTPVYSEETWYHIGTKTLGMDSLTRNFDDVCLLRKNRQTRINMRSGLGLIPWLLSGAFFGEKKKGVLGKHSRC